MLLMSSLRPTFSSVTLVSTYDPCRISVDIVSCYCCVRDMSLNLLLFLKYLHCEHNYVVTWRLLKSLTVLLTYVLGARRRCTPIDIAQRLFY